MREVDVIVFATPIYYYEMSGPEKTLLDRANPLFTADYAFRSIYFLSARSRGGRRIPASRALSGLEGWINCFERAHLTGCVFAGGVNEIGDIQGHAALKEAYQMGGSI